MRYLPPLTLQDQYFEEIEREVSALLFRVLYKKLYAAMRESGLEIKNSMNDITDAFLRGRIYYDSGRIYGSFNATISKTLRAFGGKYDKRSESWTLPSLPPEFQIAIAQAESRTEKAISSVVRTLDTIDVDREVQETDTAAAFDKSLKTINQDFERLTSQIAVAPKLTPEARKRISKNWATNMDLYVKDFAKKEILDMRQKITGNTMRGQRAANMVKTIQESYGVSKRKAKFLARQETSLLMSKFQQERYKDIGITKYRWGGSEDERERKDHRALNNKIFSWDSPPITDRRTGARNHPGEDFNCFLGGSRVYVLNRIEKCFRHWYCGKLTRIITASGKTIRATPNHPVLTVNGWKAIGLLNEGDHIIKIADDAFPAIKKNGHKGISTIREIFESHRKASLSFPLPGQRDQFHGDGSTHNIDVVDTTCPLGINRKSALNQFFSKFHFSVSNLFTAICGCFFEHLCSFGFWYSLCSSMGSLCQRLPLLKRKSGHPDFVGFGGTTDSNTILNQSSSNHDSFQACSLRDGKLALARDIRFDDRFYVNLQSVMGVALDVVIRSDSAFFMGHVYNLQTDLGYYTAEDVIVSNCRCVAIPVVDFL